MTIPILTFFNNRSGVGKTSLVYHVAWMLSTFRKRILVVDLDPQANLTAAMLTEEQIEEIWTSQENTTIYTAARPLIEEVGDISEPVLKKISDDIFLLPGDVKLSSYEENLSTEWANSVKDDNFFSSMRILSSFWQIMQTGARKIKADLIMVDTGSNLGAINKSVLIATDYVVIPLAADFFSLQGLKYLGPTLISLRKVWVKWLNNWKENFEQKQCPNFSLPEGKMLPIGYLCQQPNIRLDRPIKAYDKWILRMPSVYHEYVLHESPNIPPPDPDPECLATIKHYRSLIPMGQEHRKPIFNLNPADGAIGSHAYAVQSAKHDYKLLAEKISAKTGIVLN